MSTINLIELKNYETRSFSFNKNAKTESDKKYINEKYESNSSNYKNNNNYNIYSDD